MLRPLDITVRAVEPKETSTSLTHLLQVSTSLSCSVFSPSSVRWRWRTARLQTGPARTPTQSSTAGRPTSTWPTWGPSLGWCSQVKTARWGPIQKIYFFLISSTSCRNVLVFYQNLQSDMSRRGCLKSKINIASVFLLPQCLFGSVDFYWQSSKQENQVNLSWFWLRSLLVFFRELLQMWEHVRRLSGYRYSAHVIQSISEAKGGELRLFF